MALLDSSGIAGCKYEPVSAPVVIVEVSVGVCEIETTSELPSQFSFVPTAAIVEPTDFFVEWAALFFASKSVILLRILSETSELSADEWCV